MFIAGSAALLAVPRPVDPTDVPEPMIDPRGLERATRTDEARASAAEREGLDMDVRELGSAVRELGIADEQVDARALWTARARITAAAARALGAGGEESVLRLRAYQLRLFLGEVRRWQVTGEESRELHELGGGFLRMLRRNGWIDEGARGLRMRMDGGALRAAWKRRWNEITGVQRAAFEPSLDEQRALYRFLLKHPSHPGHPGGRVGAGLRSAYEHQYLLKKIDELGSIDVAYPADLARGIVLYRLGSYPQSVEAFRRHLDASPDGPFTLRARNYLRAALGRVQES